MESITLIAPDISCDHCKATIEREFATVDGVQRVSVDVPSKRVDVHYDAARTSREALVARLDDEGYPATG